MLGRPEEELWQPGHTDLYTHSSTAPGTGIPTCTARGGVQSKITAQKAIVLCR